MDTAEDVFSVGPFSKMLGSRLEQLASARNRRKAASNKASLILVDRSLDLGTPSRCRVAIQVDFFLCEKQPQYRPENRPEVPFEKDTYINSQFWMF